MVFSESASSDVKSTCKIDYDKHAVNNILNALSGIHMIRVQSLGSHNSGKLPAMKITFANLTETIAFFTHINVYSINACFLIPVLIF